MSDRTLTGNTRIRVSGFFKTRIIIEVEELVDQDISLITDTKPRIQTVTYWREATVNDFVNNLKIEVV